ncbi:hypothetical protein FOMPIDRAFT_1054389 [Fomitopsis schrenkii]|uniref:Uncharacterized protein n=1 Tax=Fomitopsis schrenkii TaxID=2126942 RepID=S8DPL8_FOMSC|nr:hypothetical protein FOMPIDRAFT_1054389 [Fomitopsis schrenkii]
MGLSGVCSSIERSEWKRAANCLLLEEQLLAVAAIGIADVTRPSEHGHAQAPMPALAITTPRPPLSPVQLLLRLLLAVRMRRHRLSRYGISPRPSLPSPASWRRPARGHTTSRTTAHPSPCHRSLPCLPAPGPR